MIWLSLVALFHLSLAHGLAIARSASKPEIAAGFDNETIAKVEANMLAIATHRLVLFITPDMSAANRDLSTRRV